MADETTTTLLAPCPSCDRVNRVRMDAKDSAVCGSCKTPLPIKGVIPEASGAGLDQLIRASSNKPVVAYFWAAWCAPCRVFGPAFERAAALLTNEVAFAKVDIGTHVLAADRFAIRGVPTLIVLRGGIEINRIAGALPEQHIIPWIQGSLAGAKPEQAA